MAASIEQILENFNREGVDHSEPVERKPLTLWIPADYKEKYESLQNQSKRKFGKALREIVKISIDRSFTESEKAV
jgi:hypothetical protein